VFKVSEYQSVVFKVSCVGVDLKCLFLSDVMMKLSGDQVRLIMIKLSGVQSE